MQSAKRGETLADTMRIGKTRKAGRGRGHALRGDEKSAEVIDRQGVEVRPLLSYVCKILKRKGLKVGRAKAKSSQSRKTRVGEWQTRGTIA